MIVKLHQPSCVRIREGSHSDSLHLLAKENGLCLDSKELEDLGIYKEDVTGMQLL
jgi:hypothetical protein